MTFLVTGANGYIGSKLVPYLLGEGHKVRCLVRTLEKGEPLAKLGAEVVAGDITDRKSLRGIADGTEIIYHLAGDASGNQEEAYRVNVGGTENLMKACHDKGVKAFIFASSAAVYGDTRGETADEDSPTSPYTSYSRSKLAAENVLLDGYDDGGFPAIILRLATVYGPGSLTQLEEAMKNGTFRILGRGDNWMNFIYIDDLSSILRSLPKKVSPGQTYIVCDDEAVTSKDFYGYMARKLGVNPPSHRSAPLTKLMASAFNSLGRLAGTSPIITPETIKVLLSSRRLSNRKMKRALGITLSYPTHRDGLDKMFG